MSQEEREADIRRALARVDDPELDESVTDLRFIERLEIDAAGGVSVGFRLPTYWCAANFAFLMAHDIRREVAAVPWVTRVDIRLGDHMYADQINRGMTHGLSFRDTFGVDAAGDLDDLRRIFLVKSFQRRQEALLRHLLAEGLTADALAAISVADLDGLDLCPQGAHLRRRYLDRRGVCARVGETAAFVDAQGQRIDGAGLVTYLASIGRIGINAEFNGVLCRGLLAARFNEPVAEPGTAPGLRHFVREAAGRLMGRPQGAT